MTATPYYDLVPRDPIENLRWRIRCRERAMEDKRFRDALWQACMEDVCFWMAFACWGYDPRARFKVVPFIPHPHQEVVFVAMDEAIDRAEREEKSIDVILDKARAQGGTFGYLWVDLRRWLRDRMFSAGYVTRNEDLIDSKSDSSTVLWKIGWAIERLPFWMQPDYERHLGQHTFINKDNGSLLRGYSAGQDVAAGGRASCFTIDEAGARDFVSAGKDEMVQEALHDVTNCLAKGTIVVTERGPVRIEDIVDELVWDGVEWVSHGGITCHGERETIDAYGIRLTSDHQVLTTRGWRDASERLDREELPLPDGYSERWDIEEWQCAMAVPVLLREPSNSNREQVIATQSVVNQKLRLPERRGGSARHDRDANVLFMEQHDWPLHEEHASEVPRLRRSRHHCLSALGKIRELPGGYGRSTGWAGTGASGERQRLRQGELLLGNSTATGEQPAQQPSHSYISRSADSGGSGEDCRSNAGGDSESTKERVGGGRSAEAVYDILNCGPRSRFTVIDGTGRPLVVHNCIRMVSARYCDSGVFHEACENPDTAKNGVYLVLDWKDHPYHGKHSYIVHDGKPQAIKPEDQEAVDRHHKENPDLRARLERKGFKFEGVVRSPWYDMRCLRPTSTPRLIASQLDRNPKGAVGKVFSSDLLDRMKRQHCKLPVWVGQPVFDAETLKLTGLIPRDDGPLKLWFTPGLDNKPPLGPFTAGCDIASGGVGAYSSNSVMSALDNRTGEQVLEYAIKGLEPRPFARRVVGLCMWLRNALLGWEDSGVSGGFAKEIMESIYYGNVFFRDVTQLGSQKKSRKPGWPCRDADKADMFEQMALSMEQGRYIPRSEEMITECGEYEWDGDKIIHVPTKNKGATQKNHGDRAISSAGSWLVFSGENAAESIDSGEENGQIPEYGSFLWRERQERARVNSGSPGYGIRDLVGH